MATRFTKIHNGNWVIEATDPLAIYTIKQTKKFIDHEGKEHHVKEFLEPIGHPEAPYFFFVEAVVAE
jgi:hypothetical protein